MENVEYLQKRQRRILSTLYRCAAGSARQIKVNNMYTTLTQMLIASLGPSVSCTQVDPELANTFSDWYKDVHGVRPKHFMTRDDVKSWIVYETTPSVATQRAKEWDEESKYFDSIKAGEEYV